MKKVIFALLASATVLAVPAATFAVSVPASGVASSKVAATIPATMKPGTIITYDKNNKMVIVHEFNFNSVSLNKQPQNAKKADAVDKLIADKLASNKLPVHHVPDAPLPAPQPGMTVFYDGMGKPTKITLNGKPYQAHTASGIRPLWNSGPGTYTYGTYPDQIVITSSDVTATGWVTWYDGEGQIGDHDNVLTEDDCATPMNYDDPADGMSIRVRNLENNIVGYVTKNDVGGLPDAVLDIMPDEMSSVFGQPVDVNAGTGRFGGRYYHTY